jgi:phosphoglycerate kinase
MTFFKLTIRDVPLDNKTVLVRADYNVPMHDGSIDDDLRIRASVPTLQYLLDHNCKVVIISHLGRPEGRDPKFSLAPIARRLGELLGQNVNFVDDCIGDGVYQAVKNVPMKSVTLLENLRYYKEEEADDEEFAKKLAHDSMAAYFVQDGFGVVHRAHASTHAITLCLPSVSGLLLEKEYTTITEAMENPKRPLVAVIGGAKISDKIGIIQRFVEKADQIIIGGAMANTFLKTYKGIPIGKSLVEDGQASTLAQIYDAAKAKVGADNVDEFIQLPIDLGVATEIDENAERRNVFVNHINENDIALDIGDASIDKVVKTVASAGTVIWNGTLGYAELPAFAHGSARLALSLATQKQTTSIIGGGDTADFVLKWDAEGGKSFTHVSTGGGASLELMAGDKLPGIESLLNAYK